ncbi:MAG TPA: hypothetical protein VN843_22150, partial [Anaerolineales bacterium]|nr:hypothetical protein [Anaerolineales bacterium]
IRARRSDSPGIGPFESSEEAHEGGLATAVGTDQTHALVVAEAEGDVMKDRLDAVSFVDMVCSKHNEPVV